MVLTNKTNRRYRGKCW